MKHVAHQDFKMPSFAELDRIERQARRYRAECLASLFGLGKR